MTFNLNKFWHEVRQYQSKFLRKLRDNTIKDNLTVTSSNFSQNDGTMKILTHFLYEGIWYRYHKRLRRGGGGGLSRLPMISKTVDSTTFQFCRPLELSIRGKQPLPHILRTIGLFNFPLISYLSELWLENVWKIISTPNPPPPVQEGLRPPAFHWKKMNKNYP